MLFGVYEMHISIMFTEMFGLFTPKHKLCGCFVWMTVCNSRNNYFKQVLGNFHIIFILVHFQNNWFPINTSQLVPYKYISNQIYNLHESRTKISFILAYGRFTLHKLPINSEQIFDISFQQCGIYVGSATLTACNRQLQIVIHFTL